MKSWEIKDVRKFMAFLLGAETFDSFLLSEASVSASMTMDFDGRLKKGYYSDEELKERLETGPCIPYSDVRHIFLECIKGKNTPRSFRFVFRAPDKANHKYEADLELAENDIDGMFLNVSFENGKLLITAAVSEKSFSMDKSLENRWCDNVQKFLANYGIDWV